VRSMLFKKPSNYREWSPDQELLPIVEFLDSNRVRIQHVRNISYRTQDDYDLRYYDATYDLDAIDSVWFLLAPFNLPGVAHTLGIIALHFLSQKSRISRMARESMRNVALNIEVHIVSGCSKVQRLLKWPVTTGPKSPVSWVDTGL